KINICKGNFKMKIFFLAKWLHLIFMAFILTGCATAISKNLRAQADEEIFFEDIKRNPEAFEGKIVILGGDIIQVTNLKEGTQIEILQKPTDFLLKPRDTDQSHGRFMALIDYYLDPAIYSKGRQVTVAGKIIGIKNKALGEIEYIYPLIQAEEIHLWPKRRQDVYPYEYPYHYPVHFHWWYHPYWRY
ncbi:MAG: Slp family lipoprotein, partial [Desulfobacterales bacterium]